MINKMNNMNIRIKNRIIHPKTKKPYLIYSNKGKGLLREYLNYYLRGNFKYNYNFLVNYNNSCCIDYILFIIINKLFINNSNPDIHRFFKQNIYSNNNLTKNNIEQYKLKYNLKINNLFNKLQGLREQIVQLKNNNNNSTKELRNYLKTNYKDLSKNWWDNKEKDPFDFYNNLLELFLLKDIETEYSKKEIYYVNNNTKLNTFLKFNTNKLPKKYKFKKIIKGSSISLNTSNRLVNMIIDESFLIDIMIKLIKKSQLKINLSRFLKYRKDILLNQSNEKQIGHHKYNRMIELYTINDANLLVFGIRRLQFGNNTSIISSRNLDKQLNKKKLDLFSKMIIPFDNLTSFSVFEFIPDKKIKFRSNNKIKTLYLTAIIIYNKISYFTLIFKDIKSNKWFLFDNNKDDIDKIITIGSFKKMLQFNNNLVSKKGILYFYG